MRKLRKKFHTISPLLSTEKSLRDYNKNGGGEQTRGKNFGGRLEAVFDFPSPSFLFLIRACRTTVRSTWMIFPPGGRMRTMGICCTSPPPLLSSPFSLDCLISRGQSVESFARLSPAGTRWLKMFLAIWRINWNCRWQRRSCFSKTYNIPPPRFPRNSSAIRYPRTFPFLPPLSPLSPCYFYARKKTSKYNCGNWGKLRINSTSPCFFLLVMNSVVENVFFRACCYLFLIWVIIDICVFVTYCYMLRRYSWILC